MPAHSLPTTEAGSIGRVMRRARICPASTRSRYTGRPRRLTGSSYTRYRGLAPGTCTGVPEHMDAVDPARGTPRRFRLSTSGAQAFAASAEVRPLRISGGAGRGQPVDDRIGACARKLGAPVISPTPTTVRARNVVRRASGEEEAFTVLVEGLTQPPSQRRGPMATVQMWREVRGAPMAQPRGRWPSHRGCRGRAEGPGARPREA